MIMSGTISEVHIKNLQSFPFIFFNEISECKIEYSVATTNKAERTEFVYNITLNLESNDNLPKRYEALQNAVRALFWKEAQIIIKLNGQEVYKNE